MSAQQRIFLDEDVLRVQNEVRRYNEQRVHDGDVTGEMQHGHGSDDGDVADKSRSDFVQDASAGSQRK